MSAITRIVKECKQKPESAMNTLDMVAIAAKRRELPLGEYSAEKVFRECFGERAFTRFKDRSWSMREVKEASGPVMSTAFSKVNAQYMYANMLEGYEAPEHKVFHPLIPTKKTVQQFGEKMPRVNNVGDQTQSVLEGTEYPRARMNEDLIETPPPVKYGQILELTREAIVFDRTAQVVEKARAIGEWHVVGKEKRAIRAISDIGESADPNNIVKYRYRWGLATSSPYTPIATYGDNSGDHNWDNLAASNALVDYTNIELAWELLRGMTDPFTGEPIYCPAKNLIVREGNLFQAYHALAPLVKVTSPGYATTGNPVQTEIPNPALRQFGSLGDPLHSQLWDTTTSSVHTDNEWIIGDISKALVNMEVWPLELMEQGPDSEFGFTTDTVLRLKSSEMHTYAVVEPRALVKCKAS